MKHKNLLYIMIPLVVILISISGYFIYKNRGTYSDIAGEWQVEKNYSDEDNINQTINKLIDQVAEEFDLPNTETVKISRDGKVTILSNGLNLRKNETYYNLPKKRDKKTETIPVTFEFAKIKESPLYWEFFPTLLKKISQVDTKNEPFDEEELADYKEMFDQSKYSKTEISELLESKKEFLEKESDSYKKVLISGDELSYELYPNEESEKEPSFRIVNKNKIQFIAGDGETVMATYVRK